MINGVYHNYVWLLSTDMADIGIPDKGGKLKDENIVEHAAGCLKPHPIVV